MRRLVVSVAVLMAALVAAPSAASAADGSPCGAPTRHPSLGAVQYCPLWMPARGSIPVHALDGGAVREVGRLVRAGSANWFVCQSSAPGRRTIRFRDPAYPYTNVWWARTLSDTGAWGWVSEVYFQGGANDERDGRLRICTAAEAGATAAAPPAGAPQPVAPPAKPAPPPRPRPKRIPLVIPPGYVRCRAVVGGERATVTYRLRDRWSAYTGQFQNGHPQTVDVWDRETTIGTGTVRASTCLTRQGWRLLADVKVDFSSPGVDGNGAPTGSVAVRGWRVAPAWARGGVIGALATKCWKKGGPWGALKQVLGLPVLKPTWISVVAWGASFFVPEDKGVKCRFLGTTTLRLGVSRRGRLTVDADGIGPIVTNTDKTHFLHDELVPRVSLGR